MKKLLFLSLIVSLFALNVNAQSEDYKSTISAYVGYSLTGTIVKAADDALGSDVTVTGIPAIQVAYDFGITKWFSLGLAGSYQTFNFDIPEYSYLDANLNEVTEAADARFNRMTFGIRPLFHYANTGKLDMYSGLRVHLINRGVNINSTDENFTAEDLSITEGTRFGVGIVAYGVRYYFTDNIGAGLEIMWGAPYIGALQVNYRF